jgi:hypothetical protein
MISGFLWGLRKNNVLCVNSTPGLEWDWVLVHNPTCHHTRPSHSSVETKLGEGWVEHNNLWVELQDLLVPFWLSVPRKDYRPSGDHVLSDPALRHPPQSTGSIPHFLFKRWGLICCLGWPQSPGLEWSSRLSLLSGGDCAQLQFPTDASYRQGTESKKWHTAPLSRGNPPSMSRPCVGLQRSEQLLHLGCRPLGAGG